MEGRADLDGIYDRGFAEMFNFIATVEGPATKRPGTKFINPADETAVRLERFVFNTTQAYALEFGDEKVRFFTNGGQIEAAGLPYEVALPYAAADVPRLCLEPSYDRIYISHAAYPPAVLTRVGAEAFTFAYLALENGPFKNTNTVKAKTITLTGGSSEIGGSATIESNVDLFDEGQIGSPILLEAVGFTDVKAWEPNVKNSNLSVGDLRRSDGKVYRCVTIVDSDGRTGSIQPTHFDGIEWDGSGQPAQGTTDDYSGVEWEYVHDRYGIGTISAVASATEATITVTRRLPGMLTDGTYKWAFGSFSDTDGYPHLNRISGGRLCYWKGIEFFGSVSGDYGGGRANFVPFTPGGLITDDMAFRRPIAISDPPLWAHADKDYILCGSASQEVVIGQLNRAAGLSGNNLRADPQSSYGSAAVWPVRSGAAVIFPQRGGRKIRELEYTYERERFAGANLTVYARHIARTGIRWLAFQQEPEEMLWGGRADGTLIAHPHSAEQATKGFSRAALGSGTVLWATSIPSEDGSKDDLWLLAELEGQKCILRMADWWDEDLAGTAEERLELVKTAVFVDYAVSYDGVPKQMFTTGLSHLEGLAVRILADGHTIDGHTVTGGQITLPRPASKVTIGIGYQARLRPMRPELRGGASIQGLLAKIKSLVARLIDTTSLRSVEDNGEVNRMFERFGSTDLDTVQIYNGDTNRVPIGNGSSRSPAAYLVSDDAGPCVIASTSSDFEVEDPRG